MRQSFFFKTCEVVTNLHGHWMNPLLHGYMGTNECELQTPKARGSRVTRGGLRVVCPGPVVILLHFPSAATILAPGAGQSLPTPWPLTPASAPPSADMGSFEEGEKHQRVSHGEAAVIRAPRIASFPRPQVTWFRDGRKIPPSSRM